MVDVAVELWTGGLPRIGWIAEHHWLLIVRPGQIDRWEVWQTVDCGGQSWGHLHRNLMPPRAPVSRFAARCLRRWEGPVAERLAERIEAAPHDYPWTHWYRYVPGPNSNTFVQWVLAGECRLGRRGIGRGFANRTRRGA